MTTNQTYTPSRRLMGLAFYDGLGFYLVLRAPDFKGIAHYQGEMVIKSTPFEPTDSNQGFCIFRYWDQSMLLCQSTSFEG